MAEPIYKIATSDIWTEAKKAGTLHGTAVDLADGFIHFSTARQLRATLEKHYRGQGGLVLATIDPARLPQPLKWEPARGGELFPHLYTALPMSAVIAERDLIPCEDGSFDLPESAQ